MFIPCNNNISRLLEIPRSRFVYLETRYRLSDTMTRVSTGVQLSYSLTFHLYRLILRYNNIIIPTYIPHTHLVWRYS